MTTYDRYNAALPVEYGAKEIKEFIGKFTLRGFAITTSIIAVLLALFLIIEALSEADDRGTDVLIHRDIPWTHLEPPADNPATPNQPPIEEIIPGGPAQRAGNPVPVPDAVVGPDMKEFATVEIQSRASAEGFDGIDQGSFAPGIEFDENPGPVELEIREAEPGIEVFTPVDRQPMVDLADLQKNVVYPELARRAGIEGTVVLRVLIDTDGLVRRMAVLATDSELLNEAAMNAVIKSTFTPAIQNSEPVMCWVNIPIRFRLR
ncbi:MAG: energy transducer TonB [Candidatus Kapaibacterium sp.]